MNVEFYSRDNCSYCTKLKNYLELHKIEHKEYKLGPDFNREQLLEKFPTAKTFPVVCVDNVFIGGYDQFVQMHQASCECQENCDCKTEN